MSVRLRKTHDIDLAPTRSFALTRPLTEPHDHHRDRRCRNVGGEALSGASWHSGKCRAAVPLRRHDSLRGVSRCRTAQR